MSSINTVTSIQSIERNQPVNLRSMKQNLFSLQKLAVKYNRWSLYQTLLFFYKKPKEQVCKGSR